MKSNGAHQSGEGCPEGAQPTRQGGPQACIQGQRRGVGQVVPLSCHRRAAGHRVGAAAAQKANAPQD